MSATTTLSCDEDAVLQLGVQQIHFQMGSGWTFQLLFLEILDQELHPDVLS